MAKRTDRREKKQAKRLAAVVERARRSDSVLDLLGQGGAVLAAIGGVALAQRFAQEVQSAARERDANTLARLAGAWGLGRVDTTLLEPVTMQACHWALLGPVLRTQRSDVAAKLVASLRGALSVAAPALLGWLDAAIDGGGVVPPDALPTLPALPSGRDRDSGSHEAGARRATWHCRPGASAEEFGEAVLAASASMHPRALEPRLTAFLIGVRAKLRPAFAHAALPAIGLRMDEAGADRDREALAACVGLVARLGGYHVDGEIVGAAIRWAQRLQLGADPQHRGDVEALVETAWGSEDTRPLAEAAFEAIVPQLDDAARLRLAERLLRRAPSCAVWASAIVAWRTVVVDRPHAEAPRALGGAYVALVEGGTLATWLLAQSPRRRREVVQCLDTMAWQVFLDLVVQLWDRLGSLDRGWLATTVAGCLAIVEEPAARPRAKRTTVAALRERIQERVAATGPDPELADVLRALSGIPSNEVLPAQVAAAIEALLAQQEHRERLGPRQRAFFDRLGLQLVPYCTEILHIALHEPDLLRDGRRWVDAYLDGGATTGEVVEVASMVWAHHWPDLAVHIEVAIDRHASRGIAELAALVLALGRHELCPSELRARLCGRLLEAAHGERASGQAGPTIDPHALRIAQRFARRPRTGRAKPEGERGKSSKRAKPAGRAAKPAGRAAKPAGRAESSTGREAKPAGGTAKSPGRSAESTRRRKAGRPTDAPSSAGDSAVGNAQLELPIGLAGKKVGTR